MAEPSVELVAHVQVGVTPDGKLLVSVQPPDLDLFSLVGILERAKLAAAQRAAPPAGPKIVAAPPGFRV